MRNLFLFFCILSIPIIGSAETFEGVWIKQNVERNIINGSIPFDFEIINELIIINNDVPDRIVYYKIQKEDGSLLLEGCVSKEQSAQIIIPIVELLNNETYMIILTSPNPMDKVYSVFKK
ncbi:DUF3244 domain-containing protein [Phocaeicola vulgatus]|uniref:DUF3244 domain-containing protein n=1 Tax=Phocaeicola vulgatus TaxID=821 RepID=UPI00189CF642|nr:DUF3244 domain-containing protein [Phocaeicola vulgatus]